VDRLHLLERCHRHIDHDSHLRGGSGRRRSAQPGSTYRTPYALRHTYASFSIAAGVSLFALARRMGTSVEQIDRTYGHLLPDAAEHERDLLDAFDAQQPSGVHVPAGGRV
jgi:integrase